MEVKENKLSTKRFTTSEEDIVNVGNMLSQGKVVAFPTETVYGLGANALDEEAVKKIYIAKGRPSDNPLILHVSDKGDVKNLWEDVDEDTLKLMDKFWPGSLTIVRKAKIENIPSITRAGLETVAIRMPNSVVALKLIDKAGVPIAAPSANISGSPSPTTYDHVLSDLDSKVDGVVCGEDCIGGVESTVLLMLDDRYVILRPGLISKEDIENAIGKEIFWDDALKQEIENLSDLSKKDGLKEKNNDLTPMSPGMKYKHYSPKTPVRLFVGERDKVRKALKIESKKYGNKAITIDFSDMKGEVVARDLFKLLREADKEKKDIILVGGIEQKGIGIAVINRLIKSSGYDIITIE